jgi:hypothetical protein
MLEILFALAGHWNWQGGRPPFVRLKRANAELVYQLMRCGNGTARELQKIARV